MRVEVRYPPTLKIHTQLVPTEAQESSSFFFFSSSADTWTALQHPTFIISKRPGKLERGAAWMDVITIIGQA